MFIRESLDVRVRESGDIEKITGVTLLGVVPEEFAKEKLPALSRPHSRRTEAYRQVRTNLEFAGPDGLHPSIVVTSAVQSEGKTSLATNLAVIAGHAGRNVVVVDADLRKPMVAKYLNVSPTSGLTDVLTGRKTLDEALYPLPGERVSVLSSGPIPDIPSELVGSAAMVELIEELEQRFDLVIIDTPPALMVTDALLVGVNVGGIVLVTRMGETTKAGLRKAVASVERVRGTLLGIVANAATEPEDSAYGYGYGYGYLKQDKVKDAALAGPLRAGERRNGTTYPSKARAMDGANGNGRHRGEQPLNGTSAHDPAGDPSTVLA